MAPPLVSVIVPVHNCRHTVEAALESALTQTLPPGQVEVIAVDDGSTDGSAELLDELARIHDRLTVVHQPASGGPGAPRNRGLELASGTFVFFLDADDRLGPEALARMTAMAERNGTDVVLGRRVGTGGRVVSQVSEVNIERAHPLDPGCDLLPRMSMAALQLFRRSLIDRAGLRFTEGLLSHEDHLFTTGAYLKANGVSVLADYDCYYWTARADGTSSTQMGGAATADVHAITAQAMAMIAEHTEPGEHRERLHYRYLHQEVFARLERRYLDSSTDERKVARVGCRELLDAWLTPGLLARFNPFRRVVAYCIQHDLDAQLETLLRFHRKESRPGILLESGRAYVRLPFFRDESVGIPDARFETSPKLRPTVTGVTWEQDGLAVTGTVTIPGVDEGTPEVHLLMNDGEGERHRILCETSPEDVSGASGEGRATAFTGTIHLPATWEDGRWELSVEAAIEGHTLTAPLEKPRGMAVPPTALLPADAGRRLVRPLPETAKHGTLAIEVGGALIPSDLRNVQVEWSKGRRLRVTGEPPLGDPRPGMSVLLQRHGYDGTAIRTPLVPDPGSPSRHVAEVPLAGARSGTWRVSFRIDGVADPVAIRVPGGGARGPVITSLLPPRRAMVRLDPMTVRVATPLVARLRRAAGRFRARRHDVEKGGA
ncbi:hypothetical protein Acsp03_65300 [Actinomadura sp. NBRC 104412]|uniref:glycosyltransferase family 2 protein n=1 Tax=Actinomadura sp. NBRC 104412 TaxID=3032203 RepID=UPI0024A13471|nr:glycosyltransferase family 2 protein [Actinomadura sp. NBRC 104412]GLZ09064.1 hypothetical protein Acsp03_65300 [Actinomadura sp. NBRC 104412]